MGVSARPGVVDQHPELPVNPDTVPAKAARRAVHLRPAFIAWVALGGVAGAAARIRVIDVLPRPGGFPLATVVVNVVGALVLGALLEGVARRGADVGGRRLVRLGAGTGFCGAFTTYSTFAVDADVLLREGRAWLALAYVAGSLLVGLAATAVGIWAAGAHYQAQLRKAP